MDKRITFSGDNLSIDDILKWYEISKKSIDEYKNLIFSAALNNQSISEYFTGFSLNEIDIFFNDYIIELENLVSFNLLSSTEAILKVDYLQRAYRRDKDPVSKTFRNLYKIKGNKIKLEEDLLKIWLNTAQDVSRVIAEFKGALNFRHWLAHGRFWRPKLGREYDLVTVYIIVQEVLSKLPLKYI